MELLITELEKSEEKAGLEGKIKSSVLDMVNLKCLLGNLTHVTTTLPEIH